MVLSKDHPIKWRALLKIHQDKIRILDSASMICSRSFHKTLQMEILKSTLKQIFVPMGSKAIFAQSGEENKVTE